jgi:hypothetical protein
MSDGATTGSHLRKSADPLWWGVAAILSLGSAALPKFLGIEADRIGHLMLVECALFFTGALVGCVRPDRPWRWAAASVSAFALRDASIMIAQTGMERAKVPEVLVALAGNSGMYCLYALPVLLGALLGASVMHAGLR